MGYEPFDPAKHRRDRLGHFASGDGSARMRFRVGAVVRMRTLRKPPAEEPRIASGPRRQESAVRQKLSAYKGSFLHSWLGAPEGQGGALVKREFPRGRSYGRTPRDSTMRTASGKAVALRGYGKSYIDNEHFRFFASRQRVTNRAGMAHGPKRSITPRSTSGGRHRART